jgi:hypothetical protein
MLEPLTLESQILHHLRQLPPEKQKEVLDFTEFLHQKLSSTPLKTARQTLKGQFESWNLDITEEDIQQARQEMWANFPRELSE